MRKSLLILISILLFSCGGSDGDGPEPTPPVPTPENTAPSVPSLLEPSDDLLCTDNPLDFTWTTSTDADGDAIQYEIMVASDNSFTTNLQTKIISSTSSNLSLLKSTAYYWKVRSKDNRNNYSDYTNVRKFYTEGEGVSNHLPFTAELISPELNEDITALTTTLKWSGSDVDNDPLTYDVYFGKTNSPVMVGDNISETTFDVNLEAASTYFWKIVVKDDKGGESVGQLWTFKSN